ncbi:MAG: ATP-binding protein [Defluviitaleaceae bacterium]|nr:ATP-binding protein [Defluviitaleaceae bacterium]
MHKRIFTSFAALIMVCIVAIAVLFSILFINSTQSHEMAATRDKAYLVAGLLNSGTFEYTKKLMVGSTRMTIIAPEGWVLFDNHPDTDLSINRSNRAEFVAAITEGHGQSIRSSDTFGLDTFYYAIRLENGNILRLSRTLNSLGEVFSAILPNLVIITIAILGLAYFITHRLTKRIIKPLTKVDFDNLDITSAEANKSQYEELWPYIKKISTQKQQLTSQMEILKNRAETTEALLTQQSKTETQRKEFSANVSHELKTPLTTISALSEIIGSGMAKPEDIASFTNKIKNHTTRLINIINDIIRLSEFDERKIEKDLTTFDIYELAQSVVAALQENTIKKQVTIDLKGHTINLKANYHLIDELMYNLLDNAIKYNKENGKITLSLSKENNHCKIKITDTGIGISKKHQSRVFERFYRVDSSRSKKTGGTGLGLSIVKHITEHHNGKITLESKEGIGTTITCYIPS